MNLVLLLGLLFVVISALVVLSKGGVADAAEEAGIVKGVAAAFAVVVLYIGAGWVAGMVTTSGIDSGLTQWGNWLFIIPLLLLFGMGSLKRMY